MDASQPEPAGKGPRRHRLLAGIVLVVSAVIAMPVFVALYEALDLFGFPGALGVLIALAAILGVAWAVHLVRTFGEPIAIVARSVAGSLARGLEADPFVTRARRRLGGRFARPLAWMGRRLNPSAPTGLFLTSAVAVVALLVSAFASVTSQVIHHGALAQVDVRLASLSDLLHHGRAARTATVFSLLGGAAIRIPLTVALFGLIWWRRPTLGPLVGLVLVLTLGPLLSDLGRQLIRRPRPMVGATALPGSFSYPSGHAAAAAAAFSYLAYLAVRALRRLRWQVGVSLLAAGVIVGVAYSRVVLGFHWASDVVAGTLLGLMVAVGASIYAELRPGRKVLVPGPFRAVRAGCAVVAGGLIAVALASGIAHPRRAPLLLPLPTVALADATVTTSTLRSLPLYSETLTGRPMEPVGLIFVGTRGQLTQAFRSAGWSVADPLNLPTLVHLYSAALHHRAYPTAPVTPAFLGDRPQDVAFEKEVVAGSVEQRHHARVWYSGFTLSDGAPVWLATASLDDHVEITRTTLLPNHHIAPDIDTERDDIAAQLDATGSLAGTFELQAVPPELGTNAAGDPFFTDGKAIVLLLGAPA